MAAAEDNRLDSAVVAALYLDHGEELKRFLLGLLNDSQLAHDVLQATFTKMIERGHQTKEESRKAWLFRVAYHEAMAVRRRQAVGSRVVKRLAWTKPTAEKGADEPLVHFEMIASVRKAINNLSEPQRQVVRMRIYEEKTFAEIARELDIPLGTALGRMRAALGKLRGTLKEQ